MIRLAVKVVLAAGVLAMGYGMITFAQVWWASRQDQARPAQAIVVLGAAQYDGRPSPVLQARLDHALGLWRRRLAPVVVVTGGRQSGDRFTEATASAAYLEAHGVPDAAVLREVSGRTSWESLAGATRFMKERRITDVLLVSDPFHSARLAAIASELGLRGHVSPTRTSPIRGWAVVPFFGRETAAVAAGRIVGFRRLVGLEQRAGWLATPSTVTAAGGTGIMASALRGWCNRQHSRFWPCH